MYSPHNEGLKDDAPFKCADFQGFHVCGPGRSPMMPVSTGKAASPFVLSRVYIYRISFPASPKQPWDSCKSSPAQVGSSFAFHLKNPVDTRRH